LKTGPLCFFRELLNDSRSEKAKPLPKHSLYCPLKEASIPMAIQTLKTLFARDLVKLRVEIASYQHEPNIWKIEKNIANAAGNLCLHLVGNLNTYIGKEIGGTNYVRNREAEFSLKDIPRMELIDKVNDTIHVVDLSLDKITEADLQQKYPVLVFDQITTMEYMLIHLATHLTYHLGQVNYHRRLIDS
jgi:hypothetical protein